MSTPNTKVTRELVRMACTAPSIHNTQPWAWRIVEAGTIELYADRSRQLERTDPDGRALAISCGAAVHHLVVAAEAFGLVAEPRLLPSDGRGRDLLARIQLAPGEINEAAVERLTALENRRTDRRAFTDWDVPMPRLRHLVEAVTDWGAHALAVTDPGLTATVTALLERARAEQSQSREIADEQAAWIDHGPEDGVPVRHALPHAREGAPARRDRYNLGPAQATARSRAAATPGHVFMLVFTAHDNEESWLAAGQALSALWVQATHDGLSLTPETQVIEVDRTRRLLREHLLDDLGYPQVLVRVGWQETSRPPRRPTPRRSLEEVLIP